MHPPIYRLPTHSCLDTHLHCDLIILSYLQFPEFSFLLCLSRAFYLLLFLHKPSQFASFQATALVHVLWCRQSRGKLTTPCLTLLSSHRDCLWIDLKLCTEMDHVCMFPFGGGWWLTQCLLLNACMLHCLPSFLLSLPPPPLPLLISPSFLPPFLPLSSLPSAWFPLFFLYIESQAICNCNK